MEPNPQIADSPRNLRTEAVRATRWQMIGRTAGFLCRFAVTVLLARLLTPADFGVFAVCLVVTNFFEIFGGMGIAPALIQRRETTAEHFRVALGVLLLLGTIGTLLVYSASPLLARWLGAAEAAFPLRVLSATLLINACAVSGRAILSRQLNFKGLFLIDLSAFLLGYGPIGLTAALLGWGVWSLVAATLTQAVVATLLTIWIARPPLVPALRRRELDELGSFGLKMALIRLVNLGLGRIDQIAISRMLGPVSLGYYGRASQLLGLPNEFFALTLGNVIFPAASRIQHDRARLGRAFRRATLVSNLLLFPVTVTLALLSPEIILVLFGEQWREATVPSQILLCAAAFRAQEKITSAFLRAMGLLRLLLIGDGLLFLSIGGLSWPAASYWGLEGVALLVSVAFSLVFVLKTSFAARRLRPAGLFKSYLRAMSMGFLVGLAVVSSRAVAQFLFHDPFVSLTLGLAAAVVTTLCLLRSPRWIGGSNHQVWCSAVAEVAPSPTLIRWITGADPLPRSSPVTGAAGKLEEHSDPTPPGP